MARAVTEHATRLYENIGFKRYILGRTEREYQPRPEWLEEYWTVKTAALVAGLQGEMREGGRWPRTYGRREGLEKGSDEWKGVKRIFDRTHKSDKGGDGALWSKYDKGKPHVVVHREMGRNVMEEDEAQGGRRPSIL